jgi:hypothetical protein
MYAPDFIAELPRENCQNMRAVVEFVTVKAPKNHKDQQGLAGSL